MLKRIMNEENYWDDDVEGDVVEGPVVCVGRREMVHMLNEGWKSPWTFRCIIGADCF